MTRIEQLAGAKHEEIGALLDLTFGRDRHARTAYRIRLGMAWLTDLSFAAFNESGALVGSLQCWPVALRTPDAAQVPLVMVGPVAVQPAVQHQGIGRALMDRLVETVDTSPARSSATACWSARRGSWRCRPPACWARGEWTVRCWPAWRARGPDRSRVAVRGRASWALCKTHSRSP